MNLGNIDKREAEPYAISIGAFIFLFFPEIAGRIQSSDHDSTSADRVLFSSSGQVAFVRACHTSSKCWKVARTCEVASRILKGGSEPIRFLEILICRVPSYVLFIRIQTTWPMWAESLNGPPDLHRSEKCRRGRPVRWVLGRCSEWSSMLELDGIGCGSTNTSIKYFV
jgi:hypothetical protein